MAADQKPSTPAPESSPVILSEAKDLAEPRGFFATLRMTNGKATTGVSLLITAVVLVAVAVGGVAVWRVDWQGEHGSGLSDAFKYDLQKYQKIDPALFHYHLLAEIPLDMREPRAVAIGTGDRILVAGDKTIHIYTPLPTNDRSVPGEGTGKSPRPLAAEKSISLESEPYSLTVGNAEHAFPGRMYVGMWDHVEVFGPDGARVASWPKLGILTSVAAAEKEIFVADAHAKVIWRFDTDGKQLGQIGRRAGSGDGPTFVVPSPYFPIALAPDGLLRVSNPGAFHIEAFTLDGHMELSWGKPSERIEGFCGCCNPAHIAVLPDGRIVTAEKGIPRVKVYSTEGAFESVVAGPESLSPSPAAATETRDDLRLHPVDVAADSRGRILVLDPAARRVKIFAENEK
jgi:hypothetical protein